MSRIICDRLVQCMETHNKNVFERRVDLNNDQTMRECVDFILKIGHVPVVTVKNMGTMKTYEYNVRSSDMLGENWAKMPYTKLSLVLKDSGRVKEYSAINMPKSTLGYYA